MQGALVVATTEGGEVFHAAGPGDAQALCGRPLQQAWEERWETAPEDLCCSRCRHAVDVLRLVRAV